MKMLFSSHATEWAKLVRLVTKNKLQNENILEIHAFPRRGACLKPQFLENKWHRFVALRHNAHYFGIFTAKQFIQIGWLCSWLPARFSNAVTGVVSGNISWKRKSGENVSRNFMKYLKRYGQVELSRGCKLQNHHCIFSSNKIWLLAHNLGMQKTPFMLASK